MFKFLKPQVSAVLLLTNFFCSSASIAQPSGNQAAANQVAGNQAVVTQAVGTQATGAQAVGALAKPWLNLGRAATPAEVKAWDIDVRSDFVCLPKGSGSVAKGEEVWEAKCASCHGTFGESN